jgi:hypothetical protein
MTSHQGASPAPVNEHTCFFGLIVALPCFCDQTLGLRQAADLVRDTATKFSLVASSKAPAAAVKSITDELRKASDSLVAAFG